MQGEGPRSPGHALGDHLACLAQMLVAVEGEKPRVRDQGDEVACSQILQELTTFELSKIGIGKSMRILTF